MAWPGTANLRMILLICTIIIASVNAASWEPGYSCGHEAVMTEHLQQTLRALPRSFQRYGAAPASNHSRRMQTTTIGSDFSSIRVTFDYSRLDGADDAPYACPDTSTKWKETQTTNVDAEFQCTESDVLTPAKRALLVNDLLPDTLTWLQETLSVRPVQGPLVLSNPLLESQCYREHRRDAFMCCEDQMPPSHITSGVEDTDIVLYVTARPMRSSLAAWALTCQQDQYDRPLAGQLNFIPSFISTSTADRRLQFLKALHEVYHVLGFTDSIFPDFRQPGNLEQKVETAMRTRNDAKLQKEVTSFVLPNAVNKMKEHFDCFSLPTDVGVELEDHGSSATRLKHLEERLYYNELMSGWLHAGTKVTAISLAVLEDSGWYQATYDWAEPMVWGRGEGCAFMEERCSRWSAQGYFCDEAGVQGCTVDRRFKASCNVREYSSALPSAFQYFEANPLKGGRFDGVDFCPIYTAFTNADCVNFPYSISSRAGEATGSGSRCYFGDPKRATDGGSLTARALCYPTKCNGQDRVVVTLGKGTAEEEDVVCPESGGVVDLESASAQWTGSLDCPPADRLCTGDACAMKDCSGHGVCINSLDRCVCSPGWAGEDRFSCDGKACPVGENEETCSGNADCDTSTGECVDGSGAPGCFPGWTGLDCGTRGCSGKPSEQCGGVSSCPCSGRGTCDDGTCLCNQGYNGTECEIAVCAGTPACGGMLQGECDDLRGICECNVVDDVNGTVHFIGAGCEVMVAGDIVPTAMEIAGGASGTGPGDAELSITLEANATVPAREYRYFAFDVTSLKSNYEILLKVVSRVPGSTGPPSDNGLPPIMVLSFLEDGILPTARDYLFRGRSNSVDEVALTLLSAEAEGIDPDLAGQSILDETGTIVVGVAGFEDMDIVLQVMRDGCATVDCGDFGTCVDGLCECARELEPTGSGRTFGWSGDFCSIPDCVGVPDCGGERGSCIAPSAPTDSSGDPSLPTCECKTGFFGPDCRQYNVRSGTTVLGGGGVPPTVFVDNGGPGPTPRRTVNISLPITVEAGAQRLPVFVDPQILATCCNFTGTLTYHAQLFVNNQGPDPMLRVRSPLPPTFTTFDGFDERAWSSNSNYHELSGTIENADLLVVAVANGRYATRRLLGTVTVTVSAFGCPPTFSTCSGNGREVCDTSCRCVRGWEGIRCDTRVPEVAEGEVVQVSDLETGAWSYFLFEAEDSVAEVDIRMQRSKGSSQLSAPVMVTTWERARRPGALGKLTSEAAFFDYDNFVERALQQSLVLRRSGSSQRFLYIGIFNSNAARAVASVSVIVRTSASNTLEPCRSNETTIECHERACSGRGRLVEVNGLPRCSCDVGWDGNSRCRSPRFQSFSLIAEAAQNVQYLCAICQETRKMDAGEFVLFRVPPPVQRGRGLQVFVDTVSGPAPPDTNSSSRRLLGEYPRALQDELGGNPSLLASERLPRSILDFRFIRSSNAQSENLLLERDGNTLSFWIAMYGHTEGWYRASAERAQVERTEMEDESFWREVASWLVSTNAGVFVLACGIALVVLVFLGFTFDHCAPACMQDVVIGADRDETERENTLKRHKSMLGRLKRTPTAVSMRNMNIYRNSRVSRNFSVGSEAEAVHSFTWSDIPGGDVRSPRNSIARAANRSERVRRIDPGKARAEGDDSEWIAEDWDDETDDGNDGGKADPPAPEPVKMPGRRERRRSQGPLILSENLAELGGLRVLDVEEAEAEH